MFASLAIGAAVSISYAGYFQPHRTVEFSGLVAAALLTSVLAVQRSAAKHWTTVPPSFVIEVIALVLLGPESMAAIAILAATLLAVNDAGHGHLRR